MSRILLISANTATDPYPVYPLGMLVVAEGLRMAGHEVRQFDMLASGSEVALASLVDDFAPHFAGLSLRNVDNVDSLSANEHWQLDAARHLTRQLINLGLIVIVGGAGFSLLPEEILSYLGAHYGVVGEGEAKMVRLISMLEAGERPPRIMGPEQTLSEPCIRSPHHDRFLMRYYLDASGIIGVQTKRGCENHCAYCSYPVLEGSLIRCREPKDVADELAILRNDHGVKMVFFTDSVFNDRKGQHLLLAAEIIRRNLDIAWAAYFRPSGMSRDELRLLKRSGLKAIEAGTDASTEETLRALRKPFTMDDVVDFHRLCVSERVPCAHYVIFGGPGENIHTVRQGIDNLNALDKAVVFPFSGIRLHRNTALYDRALLEGIIAPDAPLLRPVFYFSPDVQPEEMNATLAQGFAGRRDRIFPPSEAQARMQVMRSFGYRGLLWDTLINFNTVAPTKTPIAREEATTT